MMMLLCLDNTGQESQMKLNILIAIQQSSSEVDVGLYNLSLCTGKGDLIYLKQHELHLVWQAIICRKIIIVTKNKVTFPVLS